MNFAIILCFETEIMIISVKTIREIESTWHRFQLKPLIFKRRYHKYRIKISPGDLQYPPLWPSCRDYGTSALSSKKWRQNIGLKMKKIDKTRPFPENREKSNHSMKMDPRSYIGWNKKSSMRVSECTAKQFRFCEYFWVFFKKIEQHRLKKTTLLWRVRRLIDIFNWFWSDFPLIFAKMACENRAGFRTSSDF